VDWVTWVLFESFPALALVAGLALFGLLAYWRRGGSPRPLLIGLAIVAGLLIAQPLVETKREIAGRILTRIERDVVAGRTMALSAALAGAFRAAAMDRAAFVDYARAKLERVRVRSVDRGRMQIEALGPERFVAIVPYQATVDAREWGGGVVPSRWRITFGRDAGAWKITTIDPPEIGLHQYSDWRIEP
jgi:hypothetical protein